MLIHASIFIRAHFFFTKSVRYSLSFPANGDLTHDYDESLMPGCFLKPQFFISGFSAGAGVPDLPRTAPRVMDLPCSWPAGFPRVFGLFQSPISFEQLLLQIKKLKQQF